MIMIQKRKPGKLRLYIYKYLLLVAIGSFYQALVK
jgi:hypothetical protein